jgi:hypothetical protein
LLQRSAGDFQGDGILIEDGLGEAQSFLTAYGMRRDHR